MKKIKFEKLEKKLKMKIKDKEIFTLALVHVSYLNENPEMGSSNEKLEFLGDSLISFTVAEYLYDRYPELSEGDYTDIRGKLVSRETLGEAAKSLTLGNYLLLSKGEEKIGGRNNPTLLADTYEAIIGAIYLQSGIEEAKAFIKRTLIDPYLKKIIANKEYLPFKTRLQEYLQKKYHALPVYKILETSGPEHRREYKVGVYFRSIELARAKAFSKKKAEEAAAEQAFEKIRKKELEI